MDLIIDGFKLMVIGMGWVFIFLLIMIGLMAVVAKVVAPFAHTLEPPAPAPRKPTKQAVPSKDKSMIAAIIAAVHQHRNR
jgi:oxaloacetate decarboxylase gamma subunit